jgi:dihydroorotate dehydrogenase
MYNLAHRLLKKFNPEFSHNLSIKALKLGFYPKLIDKSDDTLLEQSIWGRRFKNPIGLSAGFDKNAEVIEPILNLGFGFTEVGTVTPLPQIGNPKPRIFRLNEHQAIANSLGFNNLGMEVFEKNINQFNMQSSLPNKIIGINIGNNKDTNDILDDLKILFDRLHRLSDYIVVNLSSPNTPGLRDNLKSENFNRIVTNLLKFREKNHSKVPILFKISPDISDQDKKDIALIALANDVDGLILTNTTVQKSFLNYEIKGGISGKPLFEKSNDLIRDFYTLTSGKIKIIGVGGIFNANDVLHKLKLGASLVQLYTSLAYQGPYHVKNMIVDLKNLIHQEGYRNISEVIGQLT